MDGPSIPLKHKRELLVPKSKKEWNEEDSRSIQFNTKAMYSVFCALGGLEEYNRESSCSNAKEIWDKLKVTLKVQTKSTNQRKTYPNEVVWKMLKSLPMFWDAKVEVKNLETLLLYELISSFLSHELRLKRGNKEEEKV
ncbi:hypothetical protein J1N35_022362 [Gossypium stocksii]|uniref:Uncharacterized protein n=1 Tax=Gossypium stocksii TaxID=47602 RepID=A0A9D3VG96_9ROSI|nr:hypothetical protein J1N35_022362 [Gossypium stocksii]